MPCQDPDWPRYLKLVEEILTICRAIKEDVAHIANEDPDQEDLDEDFNDDTEDEEDTQKEVIPPLKRSKANWPFRMPRTSK